MKNVKSKVIVVMCIALLIMVTGYAYFATNLDIIATGNITTNWKVNFISITSGSNGETTGSNASTPTFTDTTATMSANLQVPGDYMEYDLVLKNSGNIDAIIEEVNAVATGAPAIIFSISGINEGDELKGGAEKTITVRIEYDSTVTSQPKETTKTLTVSIKAVQDMNQNFDNVVPEIEQPLLSQLRYRVLEDNMVYADNVASTYVTGVNGIDFSQISSDTNGKGLYYTATNTQDGGTTYYFRGDVDNNYVKLGTQTQSSCVYNDQNVLYISDPNTYANNPYPTQTQCLSTNVCDVGTLLKEQFSLDYQYVTGINSTVCSAYGGTYTTGKATYQSKTEDILWRIVRINEDGSVRLVTDKIVGNSAYAKSKQSQIYFGYMYGEDEWGNTSDWSYEQATNNKKDSTIKEYLDVWYNKTLSSYTNLMAINAGFCNDRSIASEPGEWADWDSAWGYENKGTVYGSAHRLINVNIFPHTVANNAQPQFACPRTKDFFTLSTSEKGNQALTNSIGLLTADELVYAGGVLNVNNSNMYLKNGEFYWTMTPFEHLSDGALAFVSTPEGLISLSTIELTGLGVRPVINLNAKVEISGGNGTRTNPYTIKVN